MIVMFVIIMVIMFVMIIIIIIIISSSSSSSSSSNDNHNDYNYNYISMVAINYYDCYYRRPRALSLLRARVRGRSMQYVDRWPGMHSVRSPVVLLSRC